MPSSRILRAVQHNTLGTYRSRYSDYDVRVPEILTPTFPEILAH